METSWITIYRPKESFVRESTSCYYPTKLVIDKMDCLNVSCSKESQRPFQRPLYDAIVYAKSILRQFLCHGTFSATSKKSKLIVSYH